MVSFGILYYLQDASAESTALEEVSRVLVCSAVEWSVIYNALGQGTDRSTDNW